jgi:hypothetical protein
MTGMTTGPVAAVALSIAEVWVHYAQFLLLGGYCIGHKT